MNRYCIYLIIFLLISLSAVAQKTTEKIVADLEKHLQTAVGKERVLVLNRLASCFYKSDPERSITYTSQALTLEEERKDEKKLALSQYKTIL